MSQDFATLVMSADSRGLKSGEAALDSLAAAATKAEGVTSKAMSDIDRSTGVAGTGLSALADRARKSADAFAHFGRMETQIDSLAASIDPLYASSKRYEQALEQLNAALDAGVISQGRYNTMLGQAERSFLGSPMDKIKADTAAYGSELDRLRAKFSPIYAESKRYEAELNELNRAHQMGAITAREHGMGLEALNSRYMLASTGAQKFAQSAGMAKMQTQNLGYQIQDIGTMMAMGQNPFMLLAQQLPQVTMHGGQLTGVMGALRGQVAALFSPLGLVTTAFVLAGSAAISYFSSASDEAETLEDALEQIKDTASSLTSVLDTLNMSVDDMTKKYGAAAETVYNLARQQAALAVSMAEIKLQEHIGLIAEATEQYRAMGGGLGSGYLADAITRIERELGLSLVAAQEFNIALEALATGSTFAEQEAALERVFEILEDNNVEVSKLPPELQKGLSEMISVSNAVNAARQNMESLTAATDQTSAAMGAAAMNAAAMVNALRTQAVTSQLIANGGGADPLNVFRSTPFQNEAEILEDRWRQNFLDSQAEWEKRQPKARKSGGGSKKTDTMTDEMREAARVYDETRTAAERYADELDDLQQLHEMGYLSADTYSRAVEKVGEEYYNASEAGQFFNEINEDLKNGILDAIVEGENLADTFEDIAKSIAKAALEAALFGTGPFAGAGGSGGGGGVLGSIFGAIGSLFSFDGGGYTGSGSRSGGVDGKGGFPAILHPNETVVDHSRGGGGGLAGLDITVGVSADSNGNLMPFVERVAEKKANAAGQQARQGAVNDVKSNMPTWSRQTQTYGRPA